MKTIPLTRGWVAMVDDDDYPRLSEWKWCADVTSSTVYAMRGICKNRKRTSWYMQWDVLGHGRIDHKDGNGLNNCRSNLRFSTRSQNHANRAQQTNNTSGYKGVFKSESGKWWAAVTVLRKQHRLGTFATASDAARAYDAAAIRHFGEFAKTNQMLGLLP